MTFLCRILVTGALLVVASVANAQTWPTRPIKLIVSTGPGSGTDVMARLLCDRVSRLIGQQMVVENMAGAAGMIGAQAAARSSADGYTFYFAPSSSLTSNLFFYKSVPYDPLLDFTPVAIVADSSPFIVSVNPDLPVKNLPELIALAKSEPGKYSYAVDMSSGYQVAFGQLLRKRAAIDIIQVPYKSAPMMLQDTAAGVTPLVLASLGAVTGLAKGGKLRMLAIASERRFPAQPDLPTVSETIPGFRVDGWFVLVAPTGVPAVIVQTMNEAVNQFLKDPEISTRLQGMGLATSGAGTPESTGNFIRAELARWRDIAKELDIQPQ